MVSGSSCPRFSVAAVDVCTSSCSCGSCGTCSSSSSSNSYVAQWIACLTSDQKVPGSSPGSVSQRQGQVCVRCGAVHNIYII